MSSGGRTTRSRRKLAEQEDSHPIDSSTILTPPPSQVQDEGRKMRRGRYAVRHQPHPQEPGSSSMRTRHGAGANALDASTSSGTSSEPSIGPFHTDTEEIGLDYGFDLWQNIGGLASENDPFLNKASGDSTDSSIVNRSRDLHTPTPPMSPDMLNSSDVPTPMMNRPDTPTPRPGTPGEMGNPMTPMDGSLVSSSMESSSLVETHSMIGYGPPPTPMCPPSRETGDEKSSGGRTTRSKRKLAEHDEELQYEPPSKYHHLSDMDNSSLVETSSLIGYGPPPTPMCPPTRLRDHSQKQDGCFLRIRLVNFMTHKDLNMNWDNNINFVNGKNGSGKSAILTGCQLVVGHKAANTNRTTSVTGFIKKGCKFAYIEVVLSNYNGSLSIDKYGELITISRRINIGGNSIYKIGSPGENNQRVIHLHELTQIRQNLQIDPNNPIQFLQQDQIHRSSNNNSKAGSSQGKRDFQMMKDATHITELEEMYQGADENFNVARTQLSGWKEHRKFLALQEKQLKEQCDLVHRIEESENCLEQLKNELKWAEVKILEEEQVRIKSRKDEAFLEIKNLKDERKKLEDEMASFNSMKDKAKKMKASIKKEMSTYSNDKDAKINELRDVTKTLKRVENEHTMTLKAIKGYSKKIAELEAQLNEDTISYEEQNQVYQAEMEKCRGLIPEKEAELEKLRERRDKIVAESNEFVAREQKGKSNIKKMEAELNQAKKELNKRDNNFGPGMKEVLEKIPTMRWKKLPVGPLGNYVGVKDERYAPLVEYILGRDNLSSFVVQCPEDFRQLRSLMNGIYQGKPAKGKEPPVIQMGSININEYMKSFRPFVAKLSNFRTVYSLLTIKETWAEIGIIDATSCERILLFDNFAAAADIMKDESKVPGEVICAYTLQGYRVKAAPRYQFQALKNVKRHTEIIPMANASTAIHIKEEIAREKEVMETCRKSLRGYNEQGVHRTGLNEMLNTIDNEIQAKNKEINQLNNKIKHARSMIKENPVQGQDKNIQNQIKAEQDMRAEQEMKIQVRLQEIELAKQEIVRIGQEKDKVDTKIEECQQRSSELEGEYENALGTVSKIEKSKDGYSVKIEKLEKEFHQLSLQETKVVDDMNDRIKHAVDAGERPKLLERSPTEIRRETEELEAFLTNNKDIVMSKKRITLEYMNSKSLVTTITAKIIGFDKILIRYQRYLKMGQDVLDGFKMNIASLLEANFQTYTELHKLTGKLAVLWDKELLIYYVSPDKHSDARARQSIFVVDGEVVIADKQGMQNYFKNLSGGERTKSLIFLIMAMWDITDLPCHFVDEFETYMDEPSRIQIQRLLIKHAKRHPEKQFFFFTPQILAGVPQNDPSIQIFHLRKKVANEEPERGGENDQDHEQEYGTTPPTRQKRLKLTAS